MKSIIFAGIICCLIAAVDAPTLKADAVCVVKSHKQVYVGGLNAGSDMRDRDARFSAAE